jgi:hypothetical protein
MTSVLGHVSGSQKATFVQETRRPPSCQTFLFLSVAQIRSHRTAWSPPAPKSTPGQRQNIWLGTVGTPAVAG